MSLWWVGKSKDKRNVINKALLPVSPRSKRYLPCALSCSRSSIHLYGNQNGSGDAVEAEISFTTELSTVSSAQDVSNSIANRLCLASSCPIAQKTVDFMLFSSVPVQMQLLSTERLLANEHSSSKEGIAFIWCFLQRRSRLHCFSAPSSLSPCDFTQKRVKAASPSSCCSNTLFSSMVLMH